MAHAANLAYLSTDVLHEVCSYLSDLEDIPALFGTNNGLLQQKLRLPHVIPRIAVNLARIPQHSAPMRLISFLRAHSHLQELVLFSIETDPSRPRPEEDTTAFRILNGVNPTSLVKLTIKTTLKTSPEDETLIKKIMRPFAALFPQLRHLLLADPSYQLSSKQPQYHGAIRYLLSELPSRLESLSLGFSTFAVPVQSLPPSLTSLHLLSSQMAYVGESRARPISEIMDVLQEQLPLLLELEINFALPSSLPLPDSDKVVRIRTAKKVSFTLPMPAIGGITGDSVEELSLTFGLGANCHQMVLPSRITSLTIDSRRVGTAMGFGGTRTPLTVDMEGLSAISGFSKSLTSLTLRHAKFSNMNVDLDSACPCLKHLSLEQSTPISLNRLPSALVTLDLSHMDLLASVCFALPKTLEVFKAWMVFTPTELTQLLQAQPRLTELTFKLSIEGKRLGRRADLPPPDWTSNELFRIHRLFPNVRLSLSGVCALSSIDEAEHAALTSFNSEKYLQKLMRDLGVTRDSYISFLLGSTAMSWLPPSVTDVSLQLRPSVGFGMTPKLGERATLCFVDDDDFLPLFLAPTIALRRLTCTTTTAAFSLCAELLSCLSQLEHLELLSAHLILPSFAVLPRTLKYLRASTAIIEAMPDTVLSPPVPQVDGAYLDPIDLPPQLTALDLSKMAMLPASIARLPSSLSFLRFRAGPDFTAADLKHLRESLPNLKKAIVSSSFSADIRWTWDIISSHYQGLTSVDWDTLSQLTRLALGPIQIRRFQVKLSALLDVPASINLTRIALSTVLVMASHLGSLQEEAESNLELIDVTPNYAIDWQVTAFPPSTAEPKIPASVSYLELPVHDAAYLNPLQLSKLPQSLTHLKCLFQQPGPSMSGLEASLLMPGVVTFGSRSIAGLSQFVGSPQPSHLGPPPIMPSPAVDSDVLIGSLARSLVSLQIMSHAPVKSYVSAPSEGPKTASNEPPITLEVKTGPLNLPPSLTRLDFSGLTFPPATMTDLPSTLTELTFGGGSAWTERDVHQVCTHLPQLHSLALSSATVTGLFITSLGSDSLQVLDSSLLLAHTTSYFQTLFAARKTSSKTPSFACSWRVGQLTLPMSIQSISATKSHPPVESASALCAFDKTGQHKAWPPQITEIDVFVATMNPAIVFLDLPVTLTSLTLRWHSQPLQTLIWGVLPRTLRHLAIEPYIPPTNFVMMPALPPPSPLDDLPPTLETAIIPFVILMKEGFDALPKSLRSLTVACLTVPAEELAQTRPDMDLTMIYPEVHRQQTHVPAGMQFNGFGQAPPQPGPQQALPFGFGRPPPGLGQAPQTGFGAFAALGLGPAPALGFGNAPMPGFSVAPGFGTGPAPGF